MCLIVDANVSHRVFGDNPTLAGERLRTALDNNRRKIVIGGKLRFELLQSDAFKTWFIQASLAGFVRDLADGEVNQRAERLRERAVCRSDDEHVVALALISRSHVLCTSDTSLMADFKNGRIVSPPGSISSADALANPKRQYNNLLKWTRVCKGCR